MRPSAIRTLSVLAAVSLLLVACGDDDDAASDTTTTEASPTGSAEGDDGAADDSDTAPDPANSGLGPNEIIIQDFEFFLQPVESGAEVSFGNMDGATHTLTFEDGSFDSGDVVSGDSRSFTAPDPGEYGIFCTIHPSITGTLVVE